VSADPNTHSGDSLAQRFLRRLARAVCRHPAWFVWPQAVLFVACIGYTFLRLDFHTSRDELVGAEKTYHRNFLNFKKEFPVQDDLVVIVESDRPDKNRQFIERLGARLEAETNLFTDVFYKGDLKMMGQKALLFVPEKDLGELRKTLTDFKPFIEKFSQATNLVSLFQMVNTQFRTAKRETNAENDSLIGALPALRRIIEEAANCVVRPGVPPSPGVTALFGNAQDADQEVYITFNDGRIFLATAHARQESLNEEAVTRLRELVAETKKEVGGLNIGVTGEPVLEIDEMNQSQRDTTVATVVSLVLTVLIFVYGYHETGRPFKATLCLIVGLGYTMGYTTLVVGHLNILTITFAPILIGLAIDFGVHLVTRYEEELRHGRTAAESIEIALVNTGLGVFTGCLTTAGAFFAMGITDFKGIQEMGIISGGGLLVCLVPMMTLLPVLLLRGRQNVIDHNLAQAPDARARIERLWLDRPIVVTLVTVVLCGLSVMEFRRVYFDYNLLNMQSEGLPAVVFEKKLINSASNSVLFGAVIADSLDDAARLTTALKALPTVQKVASMSEYLAENPVPKLELIRSIKAVVAPLEFAAADGAAVDVPALSRTLYSLQGYFGAASDVVKKEGDKKLLAQIEECSDAITLLRRRMNEGKPGVAAEKLTAFQRALLEDVRDTFQSLKTQDDRGGLKIGDLPAPLRNRFIGRTGKYLLQVYPKKDVWQRGPQEEFVRDLRRIVPQATGTPVQLYEYTSLLKDSYIEAAYYALAAIAILAFIHFRSPICVALALLPVAVGAVWMGGLMGWRDLPFNPANIMTLPLVVGVGVTNGIHILNRFAEERNPSILAKSTGKAVLVSGLTTIAGFGSLVIADHRGISSLGLIMAVGTTTCMVAGLTFLPALLNLLMRAGWRLKKNPGDNNAQLPPG
jgi:hopanoid biosynthesis associated RND transporter like protein HpnN